MAGTACRVIPELPSGQPVGLGPECHHAHHMIGAGSGAGPGPDPLRKSAHLMIGLGQPGEHDRLSAWIKLTMPSSLCPAET